MKQKLLMTTIALLMLVSGTVRAKQLTFTEYSWDAVNKKVIKKQRIEECSSIRDHSGENWILLGEKGKTTWYCVDGEFNADALQIFGEVHLVLDGNPYLQLYHIKLEAKNDAKLHIHNVDGDEKGTVCAENQSRHPSGSYYVHYYDAAAIGGGDGESMGSLVLHGGTVEGRLYDGDGNSAAAIGGGYKGDGGSVIVYAGKLKADGWKSDVGKWSDDHGGAGIGAGYKGKGADVHIYGGVVEATGAFSCSAIGGSYDGGLGSIEFAPNMRVTAGKLVHSEKTEYTVDGMAITKYKFDHVEPERVFTTAEREAACQWRRWAKVEPCDHKPQNGDAADVATTYSIDDDIYHTKHCRYCDATIQEKHADENCVCGVKDGKYEFTIYEPGTEKNSYVKGATTTVGAGKKFYLPDCTTVPAGYIFKGWEMNPETAGNWAAVKGGDSDHDINMPAGTSVEAILGQGQTASFYARFIYDLGWETVWDYNHPTTGTIVSISHPDITSWALTPGTYTAGSLTIDSEAWKDYNEQEFGTHYVARTTYILNGYEYTYTSMKDVLSLSNDADNNSAISSTHGITADVTLNGRTLYKDGKWNTLCLPFDVTIAGSVLDGEGVTVQTLNGATSNLNSEGLLTINFDNVPTSTKIPAGTPFIIKWTKGMNIENLVFTNVTMKNTEPVAVAFSNALGDDCLFVGSYSPFSITDANIDEIIYLGANNTLGYATAPRTLHSCRTHFVVPKTSTSGARAMTRSIVNFGDENTTGVESIDNGSWTMDNSDGAWFSLDGRKLSRKPATKGVYIHSGNKVIIK